jgi:SAM-dependent methyltransferase
MDLSENHGKFFNYQHVHPWEIARCNFVLRKFMQYLPGGGNVLDIGCGNGYIASGLCCLPETRVAGVDSAFTPEKLRELRHIAPRGISLHRQIADIPSGNFNAVLLLDVLEHISADSEMLCQLCAEPIIASDAIYFITVPAFSWLFTGHDRNLGHCRRYNSGGLTALAKSANLDILESGYFFTSLLVPVALRKLAELCGCMWFEHGEIGQWKHSTQITNLIALLLKADTLFSQIANSANIKIPGLSCYLICRKPR